MPMWAELLLVAVVVALVVAYRRFAARSNGNGVFDGLGEIVKAPEGAALRPPEKFRPYKPIYHITMALKNATPSDWITITTDFVPRISHRSELLSQHGSGVHGVVPGGELPVMDLHRTLYTYLPERYPDIFVTKAGHLHNKLTGDSYPLSEPDPEAALRNICTTVEEDFFLLLPTENGHRCVAFVCCFPSGFDPAAKLGKGLGAIHEPVPGYEKIALSMERFFARTEVGKPVQRLNWSVQTHPDLYVTGAKRSDVGEVDPAEAFMRVELQTLSRLPGESGALAFSFKTYLYPLKDIKEEGKGRELADAIEGLKGGNAPGTWAYKGAERWGVKTMEYLRS